MLNLDCQSSKNDPVRVELSFGFVWFVFGVFFFVQQIANLLKIKDFFSV